MTGLACVMVRQGHEGHPPSFRQALISRQVRYGRVVLLWIITWMFARGLAEGLTHIAPRTPWMVWSVAVLTVILQALLGYAIPASVFEGSSWWKALLQSVREALRYPITTLLIVTIPVAALVAFAALIPTTRVMGWMGRFSPEIAVPLVIGRLVVWTAADVFMTVALAHLWWNHRATPSVVVTAPATAGTPVTKGLEKSYAVA